MTYSELIQQDVLLLLESLYRGFYLRVLGSVLMLLLFNFLFFKYLFKVTRQSFALGFVILVNFGLIAYHATQIHKVAAYHIFVSEGIYANDIIDSDLYIYIRFMEEYYGDSEHEPRLFSCTEGSEQSYYTDYMNIKIQEILEDSLSKPLFSDSLLHLVSKREIEKQAPVRSSQIINLEKEIEEEIKSEAHRIKNLDKEKGNQATAFFRDKYLPKLMTVYQQSITEVKENYRTIIFLKVSDKNIPLSVTRTIDGTVFYEAREEDLAAYFDWK